MMEKDHYHYDWGWANECVEHKLARSLPDCTGWIQAQEATLKPSSLVVYLE